MPIETEIQPFVTWFPAGLVYWLLAVVALAAAGAVIGWLFAAARKGPLVALGKAGRALGAGAADLLRISPRRVWALSWLGAKESIRRPYVLVVLCLFALILLYAGWFEPARMPNPARYYIDTMLWATGLLVLLFVLVLSALSLPGDLKDKTLHTVVTKPVRPSEVVLGRMLGLTLVGTFLLLIMGPISYVFVIRLLSHTHQLAQADVKQIERRWSEPPEGTEAGEQLKLGTMRPDSPAGHVHELYVKGDFGQSRIRELKQELQAADRPKAEQDLLQEGWRKTPEGWLTQGSLRTEPTRDHWHEFSYSISADENGNLLRVEIEPESRSPQGMLVARVPIYGKLRFLDRGAKPAEKGVNTGDEWMYRSYIEGGTLATAIWSFEGITAENFPPDRFPDGLPLEMTIEVFRTYKGNTDDPAGIPGILGSLAVRTKTDEIIRLEEELEQLKRWRRPYLPPGEISAKTAIPPNPYQGQIEAVQARLEELRRALPPPIDVKGFTAKEFTTDVRYIPRLIETPDGRKLDLFNDVAHDGHLEVWLRCAEPAQYFGVAQPDVYFRAGDASFALNFVKGYLGIWLQMLLVIGLGVTFSTFLSGPIAVLATSGVLLAGMVVDFIAQLAAGLIPGGGPLEALIRLVTHQNVVSEMEPGLRTTVAKMFDGVVTFLLGLVAAVMPAFGRLNFAEYVAYGYNVSANLVLQSACRAMGFLLPVFVAGYFFLKLREIAK
jgi:hypothetical protein